MVTTDFFVLIRNARASQVLNGFSFEQHLVSINKALIEARSRSIPHHSYPKKRDVGAGSKPGYQMPVTRVRLCELD